jgi:hypothetical protein
VEPGAESQELVLGVFDGPEAVASSGERLAKGVSFVPTGQVGATPPVVVPVASPPGRTRSGARGV